MATIDPTSTAPAAHADVSTPATEAAIDATIARKERGEHEPFDMVCEMEEPLLGIRDYAAALSMMAEDLDRPASGAVGRIARSIEETVESLEEWRGKLFHALHPRRGEPDFPDDGNGEAEEAEGGAV